jgi:hypothetical protein
MDRFVVSLLAMTEVTAQTAPSLRARAKLVDILIPDYAALHPGDAGYFPSRS